MTNTHCDACGYNFAAFGRVHRCVPRVVKTAATGAAVPSGEPEAAAVEVVGPAVSRDVARSGTYKYRDPDKWRAYMRDYMRQRRAKIGG